MHNVIELKKNVTADFDELESCDLDNGVRITVYSDVHDLLISNKRGEEMDESTIFGLNIDLGEKSLMMDVSIDELELFASSVLKHIEIIRKSYGEQIKTQYDKKCFV